MRIPKNWVPVLAKEVVDELLRKETVKLKMTEEQAARVLEDLILEELMVEDKINAEVHEILKKFDSEIEKGRLDYRKLFEMTKQKIVKERNVVL